MQEAHPQPETTDPHRTALDALASGYAERLDGVMSAPDATGAQVSFSAIPSDLFQKAFDAWKGTHRYAARSREHAKRGVYRFNPHEPRDLQAVADVLVGRGDFLAAAAVHAERAKLHHDTVSVETRAQRAEVERTVAGLLERADRPGDALQVYKVALQRFEAGPGRRSESARSCQESISRLEARSYAEQRLAQARSTDAANNLAAERERLTLEAVEFFQGGQSTDGVRRPNFRSTEELSQTLEQHLRDGKPANAEILAKEIDFRLAGQEPGPHFLRNRTALAELRERRGAVIPAEPLRESVYLTSVRMYGHSDPKTIEAARAYVDNLRSEYNLRTPEIYAKAYAVAQSARRKADHGRLGDALRYLASRRRSTPPVPKDLYEAAMKSLERSAMEAGKDARRTADQLPPRLYTNSQRGLKGAVGRVRRGGTQHGAATRRKALNDAPRVHRSGR
ncbi:hypothetical protein DFP74_1834 [Nocardiopsis sp. Huas11]|uniref:hypothetical protein n=1 Tax=Nocardiopsis sp. Huas11 TaxID=2183912 RepID=UPI000EB2FC53|nr:hypothetical protein [Nocardiopsis sp. Huas11]RKS06210.1 hypothetical protein DFP74_1834 [Nocardiopsis sp. Huas11]